MTASPSNKSGILRGLLAFSEHSSCPLHVFYTQPQRCRGFCFDLRLFKKTGHRTYTDIVIYEDMFTRRYTPTIWRVYRRVLKCGVVVSEELLAEVKNSAEGYVLHYIDQGYEAIDRKGELL